MTDTQLILEKLSTMETAMNGLKESIVCMDQKFTQEIGELKQEIGELKQEIGGMKQEIGGMKQEIGGIKQEIGGIKQEIGGMKQEIGGMKQEIGGMKQDIANMDQKFTKQISKLSLLIENDISKKIDIIGEGHDFLKQRLGQALHMEIKRENMELDLINLRMDVNKIKDHLNIA